MCSCKVSKSTNACACNSVEEKVIGPKTVSPVTASGQASDSYSIDVKIHPRKDKKGEQTFTLPGVGSGATQTEIVESVHLKLVDAVTEIIKDVIGDAYTGPDAFTLTNIATVQALKDYFANDGSSDADFVEVTNAVQLANLGYIVQSVYPLFLSIQTHILDSVSSTEPCATGSARVLQVKIKNCLFDLTFFYN